MKHQHLVQSFFVTGMLASVVAVAQTPPPDAPPRQRPTTPPAQTPSQKVSDVKSGYMRTPSYAQTLTASLDENTIQFFADENFTGEQATVSNIGSNDVQRSGALIKCADKHDDSASSMRWNLAPGQLLVLFEDADGKGDQLALWGKGQIPDLAKCDFNDEASAWSCYVVGGSDRPQSAGDVMMPHGSQALAATLPAGSVHLFDNQNFEDEHQVIYITTGNTAGQWQMLPGEGAIRDERENAASSLRWNLPEGVVVLLSANDDGTNTIALFGAGEYSDLAPCGFNNRASRWTWAYIGGPDTKDSKDQ